PPAPSITSGPANPTSQTSATFAFRDSEGNVSFLCQLDGGVFSACASPKTYPALAPGSHTFSVKSQHAAGNETSAATVTCPPHPPARAGAHLRAGKPDQPDDRHLQLRRRRSGRRLPLPARRYRVQRLREPENVRRPQAGEPYLCGAGAGRRRQPERSGELFM